MLTVPALTTDFAGVQDAVRRYFATRAELKRLEFRQPAAAQPGRSRGKA